MASKRKRKKKHNIRNFVISMIIIAVGSIGLYAHFGGEDAKTHLSAIKTQVQTGIYKTGEKLGVEKPVSEWMQWAQDIWRKLVPGAEPEDQPDRHSGIRRNALHRNEWEHTTVRQR